MSDCIPTPNEGLDVEYTVEEAAEYLAILEITDDVPHPKTVRRWLREGRLKGHKEPHVRGRGGAWRITLAAILAFDPGKSKGRQGRPRKGDY